MLKNYIVVSLRAFRNHKLYSVLNVLGLAGGLTVVILIAMFVRFELGFDQFHGDADNIYRVVQRQPNNFYLGSNEFAVTPAPLEDAVRDELAYVEDATQLNRRRVLLSNGGRGFYESGLFVTPSFFGVFDFELEEGDAASVLGSPDAAVITRDLARALFGPDGADGAGAVGRTFEITNHSGGRIVTVAGIAAEPPPDSHLQFALIVRYDDNDRQGGWGSNSFHTYVKLRPSADPGRFAADVQDIAERNIGELSWVQEGNAEVPHFFTQRLTDIHLRSHVNFEHSRNGDIRYVWLLIGAAALIMLTACINYTNLATARAATRGREVGVRKVAGASRSQLGRQFVGESVILALAALLVAGGLAKLLHGPFSALVERDIPAAFLTAPSFVALALLCAVLVGVIAGAYPAFVLSRMKPVKVLKTSGSGTTRSMAGSLLRSALVVVQFAVGVGLLVGVFVIRQQLDYISKAETGMDRDRVVAVTIRDREMRGQWEAVKAEVSTIPGVVAVSSASSLPTSVDSSVGLEDWEGRESDEDVAVYQSSVNYGYAALLGLEFVEGRPFSEERAGEVERAVVINETARRRLGWDTAVGKELNMGSGPMQVVGVVGDFHFHSMHLGVEPLALVLSPDEISRVLVKVSPNQLPETISALSATLERFSPSYPFEYQFLDDAYDAMYRSERRFAVVLSLITGIALVIACLGLFGLAAFVALQRRKEIGVRKTLGASVSDIVFLLSREFGRLVIIAFVVGSPIAWYAMQQWLAQFAFRVNIGIGVFVGAAAVTAAVALATVGYHAVKASMTDPVKALRHE